MCYVLGINGTVDRCSNNNWGGQVLINSQFLGVIIFIKSKCAERCGNPPKWVFLAKTPSKQQYNVFVSCFYTFIFTRQRVCSCVSAVSQTGHMWQQAALLNGRINKKASGPLGDGVKNGPICCWTEINGTSRGAGLCRREQRFCHSCCLFPPHTSISHSMHFSLHLSPLVPQDPRWTGWAVLCLGLFLSLIYLISIR